MKKTSRLRHLRKLAPAVRFVVWLILRVVSFKAVVTYVLATLVLRSIQVAYRRWRHKRERRGEEQE